MSKRAIKAALKPLETSLTSLARLDMKCVPKARPRVSCRGGFGRIYMPSDYEQWKENFYIEIKDLLDEALLEGYSEPVGIALIACFQMPGVLRNATKGVQYERKLAKMGTPYTVNRNDVDNCVGAVMDALWPKIKGLKGSGDGHVAECFARKQWWDSDQIWVSLYKPEVWKNV